jgi:hypothetical protein
MKILNRGFILAKLKSAFRGLYGHHNDLVSRSLRNICITNDNGYVPLVVSTSRSFPHSWLITGFVTTASQLLSLEEQELLTLPDLLSSPPIFSVRSFAFCVVFLDRRLSYVLFRLDFVLSVYLNLFIPTQIFILLQRMAVAPVGLSLFYLEFIYCVAQKRSSYYALTYTLWC